MRKATSSLLLLVAVLFAGCGPANPLDRRISATSQLDYNMWCSSNLAALSSRESELFRKARDEFQYFAVTEWVGEPAAEQYRHVLEHIDGLTVRAFIGQGLLLANVRLDHQLKEQRGLLAAHDHLLETPSTPDEYHRVADMMKTIGRQIDDLEAQVRENEKLVDEFTPGEEASVSWLKKTKRTFQ